MPIITLSSDIGLQDYIVGALKGILLSENQQFKIIDIAHQLSQSNYPQAAYICSNAFAYFPSGTIHIILLNAFESNANHWVIAIHNKQLIACPDNGILTMITGNKPEKMIYVSFESDCNFLQRFEILAKALAKISVSGNLTVAGSVLETIVEKYPLKATYGHNWMEGQILFIDKFENVIINITKTEFEQQRQNRKFKIEFKRNDTIDSISHHYASASEGEKIAFFNSAGYLEIAINKGNMAGLFGLQGYNEKLITGQGNVNKLFYQTVRIFFEQ